jgi:uncharacterized protein YdbL (DUF1318 family)
MMPSRHSPVRLIALCLMLSACVTINVYFPAAAAEKAADKIIENVWGPTNTPKPSAAPGASQPQSALPARGGIMLLAAATDILDFIVPAAQAQADLNISTPAIRQLTAAMEARHAQLRKYYDSGAIGLTQQGLIDIREQNAISLPERNIVRQLVAEENSNRNALYKEIAQANGHPEWEADIRKTFAQRWIDKASAGWYYQDGGSWKQK